RIADRSPAAIRLVSVLSEELSRAAAHSSDVAAASPRMQTVAIGDIPHILASPTTDRQPKMKLQSYCPSLGCEVVAGGSRFLTSYYLVCRYRARPHPRLSREPNCQRWVSWGRARGGAFRARQGNGYRTSC